MADQVPYADSTRSSLGLLTPALRRWPLLVLLAATGGALAFLWFSTRAPVYEANARIQVSKRFESSTLEGRAVYLEDYVATMTQIIASDAVLAEAASSLQKGAQLAFPLPEEQTVALDVLKGSLGISRVRDPNAVTTTSSSVLALKYTCGDPGDAKKILEAVIGAVKKYLERGYSEAVINQQKELQESIGRKEVERTTLQERLLEKKNQLNKISIEELGIVRSRVTTGRERAFSLQLELIQLERDLKAIDEMKDKPIPVRQAKLRQILGTSRPSGAEGLAVSPSAPDGMLYQLTSRRVELAERLGKDHPAMKELDGQIKYYQDLTGRLTTTPDAIDELALYEGRLRERKGSITDQQEVIKAQADKDEKVLRDSALFQDEFDLLRRQLDEYILEVNRQKDRLNALNAASDAKEKTSKTYDARVLDEPRLGRKVGPVLSSWLLPGVLLGLFAGVALAYLAEMADQSFRSPIEIRNRLGVPVFGHIPPIRMDQPATADVSAAYDPSLVVARRPKSAEAETYRAVRAQVLVASAAAGHKVIQVTSPNPGDGKSTTAANLAISLAQAGKRVALIDADFRKPRIHRLFALTRPEVGLASVVDGSTDLDAAIRPCDVDNLFLLPCGPRPANPAELLAGERFAEVLAELKGRYDHVVIDTPPLLVISDPLVVAPRADAVVLVFGINRRSRPQVERAKELLTDTGATLIGVVVNGMIMPGSGYWYGYESYAYKYSYSYNYEDKYADPYGDPDDASKT